jgi:TonB-linked SusC/RagA family outer membrane protein
MRKNFYKMWSGFQPYSLILTLLLFANFAFSQDKTGIIKGKITDDSGPLPAASVLVKGSKNGTIADEQGNFTLRAEEGTYTLTASYIGYTVAEKTAVKVISGRETVVNFKLSSNVQLQEVQVSYGKQKAREITGSVAQVDASTLRDMPVNQFAQQLAGKIAGVQVAQTSGQPGRGMSFRIRGATSTKADNQPLFVVDGMPVTGSINNINPAEIESFSILKDASATALYGSRAANGVILITTKHAKSGDAKIEFNANYGVQKIPENRVPKMMNAREFATYMKNRYEDQKIYQPTFVPAADQVAAYGNPEQYGEGTNWFKLMTRTAPIQDYNISFQSAREKSSSTVIAGYLEQQGVLINTSTKLYSLRYNADLSLSNNKLKIGINVAPSYRLDHNNRVSTDGVGGWFENGMEASPLETPYNADGSLKRFVKSPGMVDYINPVARLLGTKDDYITTRILGNAYLNYEFLQGLSLKTNFGVDKGFETRNNFISGVIAPTVGIPTAINQSFDNGSYTAEANLVYNKTFGTDHHIEALGGYSVQQYRGYNATINGTNFPSDDIQYLSAATSITAGTSGLSEYSLLSTIGRLNYNYKGKYLLSGAIRNDGSSRFGSNKRYGTFPSVSAGWVVSDENFMNRFSFIDLFKLRASYGIVGNNAFGNYEALATMGQSNYILNGALASGQTITRLENAELAWERNKQFDIGFDLEILKNRVSVTYDYYHKISDGLIQDRPIPWASGFRSILYNVGEIEFWGHEFAVNSENLIGKIKWNSNFNISFDCNIINNLVAPGYVRRNTGVSSDYFRQQTGHHLGEFYGFVFQGLYTAAEIADPAIAKYRNSNEGTLKMKDIGGPNGVPDGIISDEYDRTFIGDPTPDFNFGFTNSFNYKNFDLNITLAGSIGGQLLNAAKWAYATNMDGSRVMLKAAADHWRSADNPGSGIYPTTRFSTTDMGRQVNSQWVESGSYLAAKNISLGYRFNMKGKTMLQNFRVYASVQQAFVITGYSGMNPEISFDGTDAFKGIGVDENGYPVPRTFSLGISTTFR